MPESPRYFALIFQRGPVKYGQVPSSIGVLENPKQCKPSGEATCRTWDDEGLAVWTLRIHGQEVPGRWVIVDRQFRRVEEEQD
jgi:hypothetical protein